MLGVARRVIEAAGRLAPPDIFGGAVFVAPTGSNDHPGTEAQPWATLPFALAQVAPDDTIVMRGGTYFQDPFTVTGLHGTESERITVMAYPGETPTLDSGISTFRTVGNSDWEIHDAGKHIWRSVSSSFSGTPRAYLDEPGGETWRLFTYNNLTDLSSTSNQVYLGPGVTLDSGRVYIRTAQSGAQQTVGSSWPSNKDPRQNVVRVSFSGGSYITLNNCRYIDFKSISSFAGLRGWFCGDDTRNIRWYGGKWEEGVEGFRSDATGSAAVRDCEFHGIHFASRLGLWLTWNAVKGSTRPLNNNHQQVVFLFRGTTQDMLVEDCFFDHPFDGLQLFQDATRATVRYNRSLYNHDDFITLGAHVRHTEIAYNDIQGYAGPARTGSSPNPADPGSVYCHHNIIDIGNVVLKEWDQFGCGRAIASHDMSGTAQCTWQVYHNTVVGGRDLAGNNSLGQSYHFTSSVDVKQAIHNNIFMQVDDYFLMRAFRAATNESDNNLWWRNGGSENRFHDADGSNYATLDNFVSGTGHEANGVPVDPDFIDRTGGDYRPQASAAASGAKDITGTGWPGTSSYQAWRGALDPSGPADQIGPRA